MSWARFDDGYDDNPKCRAAGKDGRALDSAAIRYAAKNLTDGLIPDYDLSLLLAKAEVPKRTVKKLVDVGRWHGPGHDCDRCPSCPSDHHVVHDYLDFNPTGEAEREKRRKRAEAGRKGGKRSRPPGTKPTSETEANTEANASANGQANTEAQANPVPVSPVSKASSSGVTQTRHAPDDEEDHSQQPPPAQPRPEPPYDQDQDPPPLEPRVETALAILARSDLEKRLAQAHLKPIGDPEAWERQALVQRRNRHADELTRRAAEHPELSPELLAASVDAASETATGNPPPLIGSAPGNRAAPSEEATQKRLAERRQYRPPPEEVVTGAVSAAREAMKRPERHIICPHCGHTWKTTAEPAECPSCREQIPPEAA